jgi:hypothetical protein
MVLLCSQHLKQVSGRQAFRVALHDLHVSGLQQACLCLPHLISGQNRIPLISPFKTQNKKY